MRTCKKGQMSVGKDIKFGHSEDVCFIRLKIWF